MQEFTDRQYVMLHLAGTCGVDKVDWEDRLIYAGNLLSMSKKEALINAEDVQDFSRTWDALKEDKDLGEFTVDMDATSSCLQLYSILTGCRKTAEETNVINVSGCRDVYAKCTGTLNEALDAEFSRYSVKYTVMPTFYGSIQEPINLVTKPKLPGYVEMLTGLLPGACIGLQEIQNSWRSDVTEHSWIMEDGFHVVIPVLETKEVVVNIEEWGVEIPYRYTVEEAQENGINLAANVIQSVDGYVVRQVIRRANFPVWPIHDCFRTKAKHMNALRRLLINIYYEISISNMFSNIINQIRGTTDYTFNKLEDISSSILKSEYIIC